MSVHGEGAGRYVCMISIIESGSGHECVHLILYEVRE